MAKIESLKNYIGVLNEDEFIKLSKQIYDITDFICEDYPKHKEWYFQKQIPRIFTPSGEILFARSEEDENKIIAMACLKKDEEGSNIEGYSVLGSIDSMFNYFEGRKKDKFYFFKKLESKNELFTIIAIEKFKLKKY